MGRSVFVDVKEHVCNRKFLLSAGALFFILFFLSRPYMNQLKTAVFFEEGAGWLNAAKFAYTHDYFLMGAAVFAPMAGGAVLESELMSRFIIFTMPRSGRRGYTIGKFLGSAVSGGLTVVCPVILFLFVCFWQTGHVGEAGGVSLIALGGDLLRLYLFGNVWALAGSVGAVIFRSTGAVSLITFVLYYVPTVFQKRYYGKLALLSPKEWAVPVHLSPGGCIVAEAVVVVLLGLLIVLMIRRRVADV